MDTKHDSQPSDALSAEPYRYETRLEGRNIRLLQLEPDTDENIIQCRLVTKPLDQDVLYHALSYTWGDPTGVQTILCEGKVLRVTQNLHEALTEYRRRGESTPLWADAVCINQSDVTEKTEQVRMMRDVYVQADTVIIWLGQEQADIQMGLDLALKLDELFGDEPLEHDLDLDLRNVGLPEISSPDWSALASLLSRPWFSRMWIIQELLSAVKPIFWCGSITIESRPLLTAAFATMTNYSVRLAYGNSVPASRTGNFTAGLLHSFKFRGDSFTESISNFAYRVKDFEASDHRDRIFALVGLVQDIDESIIDYSKSLRQVLVEIAKHALTNDPKVSLDLLSFTTMSSQTETIPSWVPSWTYKCRSVSLAVTHSSRDLPDSSEPVLFIGTDDILDVQGKRIDTIVDIVDPLPLVDDPADALLSNWVTADWEKQCYHLASSLENYPNGQDVLEAYWRTLIRNFVAPLGTAPPEFARNFELWQRFLGEWAGLREDFEKSRESAADNSDSSAVWTFFEQDEQQPRHERMAECVESAARFTAALTPHVGGCQFCITEQGYMGWVPLSSQVGDQVCILYGCRIPYLIRPENSGFRLLGDVYLHGLMDGEAIELKHAEPEMIQLV